MIMKDRFGKKYEYKNPLLTDEGGWDWSKLFEEAQCTGLQRIKGDVWEYSFKDYNFLVFKETDKEYIYTADLVGLDKDKLHLKIEGLKATLSYDNPEDKRRQKFECSFTLPEIADTETVYTSYENGELKIVIEKLKRKIKEYSFN